MSSPQLTFLGPKTFLSRCFDSFLHFLLCHLFSFPLFFIFHFFLPLHSSFLFSFLPHFSPLVTSSLPPLLSPPLTSLIYSTCPFPTYLPVLLFPSPLLPCVRIPSVSCLIPLSFFFSTVRRTLKTGLTPEEALALGLCDSPELQ